MPEITAQAPKSFGPCPAGLFAPRIAKTTPPALVTDGGSPVPHAPTNIGYVGTPPFPSGTIWLTL